MPARTVTLPLTFEGGLHTFMERTASPQNTARELINWVPEPMGGLRVRTPWESTLTTSVGGSAMNLQNPIGMGYSYLSDLLYIVTADSASALKLWSNDSQTNDFTFVDSATGLSAAADAPGAITDYPAAILPSNPGHWTHPWMNYRALSGAIASPPPGGRSLAKHRGRYFLAAPAGSRSSIRFSDIENADSWPAANSIAITDGVAVECLCPVDEGLLIGGQGQVYLLRGAGPDTYSVIRLSGGDVMRGQSIVNTPYGVVMVGRTDVWIWNGGPVVPIDRGVDTQMTGKWVSTTYKKGKVYIADVAGSATPVQWIYDLENQSWSQEQVGATGGSKNPQIFLAPPGFTGDYIFAGTNVGAPGPSKHMMTWRHPERDRALDVNLLDATELFRATTQGLYLGSTQSPATTKHLYLRVYQRGPDDTDYPLTITPIVDGDSKKVRVVPQKGVGVHRHRIDLGHTGYEFQFTFNHEPATSAFDDKPFFDIEDPILEYDVESNR